MTPQEKMQAGIDASGKALLSIIDTVSVDCANKASQITALQIENAELKEEIAALREAAQKTDKES